MRIFIGFDPAEEIAFSVFAHSIWERASKPVSITPIRIDQLPITRPWHPKQSNEFAFTRWLVPWMCNYQGWAVFADCDMLALDDLTKLESYFDPNHAVSVVQHRYVPRETEKYLGRQQTQYARKNWSSLILFNCERCTALSPEMVNRENGLYLHQFKWLEDEQIGSLPWQWNYLVGWDQGHDAKIVHYTTGGPWFHEYHGCEYTQEWEKERDAMLYCEQRERWQSQKESTQ
jgi:hypothetical protein